MLDSSYKKTLILVLKGIHKILSCFDRLIHLKKIIIMEKFHEFSSFSLLLDLQQHPNEEIRQLATIISDACYYFLTNI